mgnify:CR=1 FL=1
MSEINNLKAEIKAFADARNWEQFHTPKNLSMAVAGEAGELVAEFQWLTAEESKLSQCVQHQNVDRAVGRLGSMQAAVLEGVILRDRCSDHQTERAR